MFSYKKIFLKSLIINFLTIMFMVSLGILILKIIGITTFPHVKTTLIFLISFIILNTIGNTLRYGPKIEVIPINDKLDFITNLKQIFNKLNWKIIKETDDILTIKPNLLSSLLWEKFIVKVSINSAELIGSKALVENIVWNLKNKNSY